MRTSNGRVLCTSPNSVGPYMLFDNGSAGNRSTTHAPPWNGLSDKHSPNRHQDYIQDMTFMNFILLIYMLFSIIIITVIITIIIINGNW